LLGPSKYLSAQDVVIALATYGLGVEAFFVDVLFSVQIDLFFEFQSQLVMPLNT
jgi:hypothetical protein|tara:strand:- start:247 stop:408 length:162 start_codon:yes stop_codon:yes gene_type:complete